MTQEIKNNVDYELFLYNREVSDSIMFLEK
jgi:hypothetical protein